MNILFGRLCCWGSHSFWSHFFYQIFFDYIVWKVLLLGVTLFWSHFFEQNFYEYIGWKVLLSGVTLFQSHFFKQNLWSSLQIKPLQLCIMQQKFCTKKCDTKSVTPFLGKRGMVRLTDLTFTTMYYVIEILLKKVRHEKCDPLFWEKEVWSG